VLALAEKAYDSNKIIQAAQSQGIDVIIACWVSLKKNPLALNTQRHKACHPGGKPFSAHEGRSPRGHAR
jgi:hypothetical protein